MTPKEFIRFMTKPIYVNGKRTYIQNVQEYRDTLAYIERLESDNRQLRAQRHFSDRKTFVAGNYNLTTKAAP